MIFFVTDAKAAIFLHLLPGILKPTGRPQRSVADAQDSFVAHFKEAKDLTICDSPRVALIGPSIFDVKQISMNFKDLNYVFDNALQALDVAFKSIWAFDREYPIAAKNCFVFIQQFFYGVEIDEQSFSPAVNRLKKIFDNILKKTNNIEGTLNICN